MQALRAVQSITEYDLCIGAGFIRNLVWDNIHNLTKNHYNDVDILWFDGNSIPDKNIELENRLSNIITNIDWSVKNQAIMHRRNNDLLYESIEDAMRFWPETATAIFVRLTQYDEIEIIAPYGLDDLFHCHLRPFKAYSLFCRDQI